MQIELTTEQRQHIAHDLEVAREALRSTVDDDILEALGMYSPDGWAVYLRVGADANATS